ncbi:hypothetical protein F5148DRAFT_523398 [Russula earlei]|uniref:Uncharacterized protein n=1 Tax=Russula earlei TaxID=71964 RepID=A0ACC0UGP4_9AGAM|nr:hypothetical protein F5148DRAFT_523398 [Russula earlei]
MANAVPLPSLNSHKIPVVVILYDSRIALDPDKCDTVLLYINQLYRCLGEAKKNIVGSVTYSPIYSYGSPISVNPFTVMRAQNELRGIPAGHTTGMTGDPFHMAMLNGYAAAFKMFDIFQAKYGQNANSNITYHLWHIAAGEQDNAEFAFSDLRDPRWGAVTAEIKKHNINFSMILLSECPNFSKLFHAISPAPIEPWFARCPRHTILLSGFVPPHERLLEL